ncbi:MAG TPA: hypothetical protein ENI41_07750 [Deltaproteobacteria bacterium]|nr:hypothetical protein [Deltaproteobacteria bacterium]
MKNFASLFDDQERKQLLKKYIFFLAWLEIIIFFVTWLWQLGDSGYDRFGPVETPFPWKAYFLISFIAPIAVTFLVGIVIVGFNKYLGQGDERESKRIDFTKIPEGKYPKLFHFLEYMRHAPFLALLILVGLGVAALYNIDSIMHFVRVVGEKSVRIGLIVGGVLLGVASIFGMIILILNYKLKKKSMDYQYKSQLAREFGLIILEDNTVINRDGQLLIKGKNWKDVIPVDGDGTIKKLPKPIVKPQPGEHPRPDPGISGEG